MITQPLFSVVIPTCQRNDLLVKCLDSLAPGKQSIASEHYEVIVTDDGSQSTAEEVVKVKFPWAKWVPGPRRGPAANRNNGAQFATAKWLVFTDDDCLPAFDWLESYRQSIRSDPKALAWEGAVFPIGDFNRDLSECPVNTKGGNFWSANIGVETNIFRKLGGFDEQFILPAHEDQDLKIRLEKITHIPFIRLAVVYHPVRPISVGKTLRQLPARNRNWVAFDWKHRPLSKNVDLILRTVEGYQFHGRVFFRQILQRQLGSAILTLAMLCFGLPHQICLFYFRLKEKNRLRPVKRTPSSVN